MESTPTNKVPWWQQEVEGSKGQILGRIALGRYVIPGLVYGLFQWRWWALVLIVSGILIAVMLQLRQPNAPLSILGNGSEDSSTHPGMGGPHGF